MAGWQNPENFAIGLFIAIMVVIVLFTDIVVIPKYYAGVITPAALVRLHQKQLWNYLHSRSKQRKQQIEKIEKALHNLGTELMSIAL